jgi:hypothetical protein
MWSSLLLASCISGRGPSSIFTVDQVVTRETELLEKPIAVQGFLRFGDDTRNLWADKQAYVTVSEGDLDPADPAWDRCITLYDIDGWRSALLKNDGHQVVVRGTLRRYDRKPQEITLSECSEWGLSIQSVVPR